MIEFYIQVKDLKKALSVAALATGEGTSNVHSHALFRVSYDSVTLYTTDEDRIAKATCAISDLKSTSDKTEQISFSAEPKKLQSLIATAETEKVKFEYEKETKTLNIYASDNNPKAYISLASFDPEAFIEFEEDITETKKIKEIPAGVFLVGLKFIQGFLPKDDKNKKYSNLYIEKSVMYGSNGAFRIGAFKAEDFSDMPTIVIRRAMLSPITVFINKLNLFEVSIRESEKFLIFESTDNQFCFGCKSTNLPMIKLPISLKVPTTHGVNFSRTAMQKKLDRLSISSWEDIGISATIEGTQIDMETIADRKSYEQIDCSEISGKGKVKFIVECLKFKNVLSLFSASNIDLYIDKKIATLYSTGVLVDKGKDGIESSFSAIGVLTLAQVV